MGVKDLWKVIEPVQQRVDMCELKGLTLAVDLSMWVVQADSVNEMRGAVTKPYLRNLFFRINYLVRLGVKLVFVTDGVAPDLKLEEMSRRLQARTGIKKKAGSNSSKERSQFKRIINECCEMLDFMGIPFKQSRGEAEAFAAYLNKEGVVDGVVTNDGDAFLYGAKTVYRNFNMNRDDRTIEVYTAEDIEDKLDLDREKLIALALFCGCDYVPKGVPGVGYTTAVKYFKEVQDESMLKRLRLFNSSRFTPCCDLEAQIRKKALNIENFPDSKVIEEFMVPKDKISSPVKAKRPSVFRLQKFMLTTMDWPEKYGLEKALPFLTLFDLRAISKDKSYLTSSTCMMPYCIVKKRMSQGVPMVEIKWHKLKYDDLTEADYYTTIEDQELFVKCFPDIVSAFEAEQEKKPKRKKAPKKKAGEVEALQAIADEYEDDDNENADDPLLSEFDNLNLGGLSLKSVENSEPIEKPATTKTSAKRTVKKSAKLGLDAVLCEIQNVQNQQPATKSLGKVKSKSDHKGSGSQSQSEDEDEDEDAGFMPLSQRLIMLASQSSNKCSESSEKVAPLKSTSEYRATIELSSSDEDAADDDSVFNSAEKPSNKINTISAMKSVGSNSSKKTSPKLSTISLSSDDDEDGEVFSQFLTKVTKDKVDAPNGVRSNIAAAKQQVNMQAKYSVKKDSAKQMHSNLRSRINVIPVNGNTTATAGRKTNNVIENATRKVSELSLDESDLIESFAIENNPQINDTDTDLLCTGKQKLQDSVIATNAEENVIDDYNIDSLLMIDKDSSDDKRVSTYKTAWCDESCEISSFDVDTLDMNTLSICEPTPDVQLAKVSLKKNKLQIQISNINSFTPVSSKPEGNILLGRVLSESTPLATDTERAHCETGNANNHNDSGDSLFNDSTENNDSIISGSKQLQKKSGSRENSGLNQKGGNTSGNTSVSSLASNTSGEKANFSLGITLNMTNSNDSVAACNVSKPPAVDAAAHSCAVSSLDALKSKSLFDSPPIEAVRQDIDYLDKTLSASDCTLVISRSPVFIKKKMKKTSDDGFSSPFRIDSNDTVLIQSSSDETLLIDHIDENNVGLKDADETMLIPILSDSSLVMNNITDSLQPDVDFIQDKTLVLKSKTRKGKGSNRKWKKNLVSLDESDSALNSQCSDTTLFADTCSDSPIESKNGDETLGFCDDTMIVSSMEGKLVDRDSLDETLVVKPFKGRRMNSLDGSVVVNAMKSVPTKSFEETMVLNAMKATNTNPLDETILFNPLQATNINPLDETILFNPLKATNTNTLDKTILFNPLKATNSNTHVGTVLFSPLKATNPNSLDETIIFNPLQATNTNKHVGTVLFSPLKATNTNSLDETIVLKVQPFKSKNIDSLDEKLAVENESDHTLRISNIGNKMPGRDSPENYMSLLQNVSTDDTLLLPCSDNTLVVNGIGASDTDVTIFDNADETLLMNEHQIIKNATTSRLTLKNTPVEESDLGNTLLVVAGDNSTTSSVYVDANETAADGTECFDASDRECLLSAKRTKADDTTKMLPPPTSNSESSATRNVTVISKDEMKRRAKRLLSVTPVARRTKARKQSPKNINLRLFKDDVKKTSSSKLAVDVEQVNQQEVASQNTTKLTKSNSKETSSSCNITSNIAHHNTTNLNNKDNSNKKDITTLKTKRRSSCYIVGVETPGVVTRARNKRGDSAANKEPIHSVRKRTIMVKGKQKKAETISMKSLVSAIAENCDVIVIEDDDRMDQCENSSGRKTRIRTTRRLKLQQGVSKIDVGSYKRKRGGKTGVSDSGDVVKGVEVSGDDDCMIVGASVATRTRSQRKPWKI